MNQGSESNQTRPAAVAGRFYQGSGQKLKEEVRALFLAAKDPVRPLQAPRALIVPHAGYIFSGRVAASGFNQIPNGHPFRRVFILASSHQMSFRGAAIWCDGNYETPLGKIAVDSETCTLLTSDTSLITPNREPHYGEHSLEVQLPFLQEKLGNSFLLVPLILGTRTHEECQQLANLLRPFFTPENLFIASSDLSHYPCYEDAVAVDKSTTEAILANSPEKLMKSLGKSRKKRIRQLATPLCGWTSVVTLLHLTSQEALTADWVDYQNSGDQPHYGDHERVVGYSAVAFFNAEEKEFSLTASEKKTLLEIARLSAEEMIINKRRITLEEYSGFAPEMSISSGTDNDTAHFSSRLPERLSEPAGAFVSVYNHGKLRGCIGSFTTNDSLAEVVCKAAASAVHDDRFTPVDSDEILSLTLEISVLTPLRRINSPEEIIPGKHGIYIKQGWSSGTFLPQVATKYGWDRDELLGSCSRDKARLGWDGWKSAELYVYEAMVFGDQKE